MSEGTAVIKRKAEDITPSTTTTVALATLREVAEKAVRRLGYSEDGDVKTLVDTMMYSQLRGGNQGLIKIITHGIDVDRNASEPKVDFETKLSARINGNKTAGMLVVKKAVDKAIAMAKEHGFGMVGTHNTCTSTGSIGVYVRRMAEEGLIGIAFAQSPEFVAPHGSFQAILGTNPMAVGIPRLAGHSPLVLDMATGAYPFFGLLEAKTAGRPIPGDVAYNSEGELTTDPAAAIAGAIRGWGGHKGGHLGLMVELLAGPLVRAAATDKKAAKNWGNLVLAIDPGMMGDAEGFKQQAQVVLERIKNAKKLPGVAEILLPGERGDAMEAAVAAANSVEVEKNLYDSLCKFAESGNP